jgi:hypothetical protein
MMKYVIAIAGAAAAYLAAPAHGAPLCMQRLGLPLQCMYIDPAACQQESALQGAQCAINPANPIFMSGYASYCVVESNLVASCRYYDRAGCDTDAARKRGACVPDIPAPHPQEDPYRLQRPY